VHENDVRSSTNEITVVRRQDGVVTADNVYYVVIQAESGLNGSQCFMFYVAINHNLTNRKALHLKI
jgi:hypothetical protein